MNNGPDFFNLTGYFNPGVYTNEEVDLNLSSDALDLMIYAINTAVTNPKQDLNKLDHLYSLLTDLKNFKIKLGENE